VCDEGIWVKRKTKRGMKIDKIERVRNKYMEGGGMEASVTS
jgi:hypothetical protein